MAEIAIEPSETTAIKRVLIVDDDDDLRHMLQEKLMAEGYECLDAEDGLEALDWLAQVGVDLVGVDLVMPRMGGHELIMAMRESKEWAGIPILLLSGYADLTRYRSLPVDGIHLKPFSLRSFVRKVQTLIGPPQGTGRRPEGPAKP